MKHGNKSICLNKLAKTSEHQCKQKMKSISKNNGNTYFPNLLPPKIYKSYWLFIFCTKKHTTKILSKTNVLLTLLHLEVQTLGWCESQHQWKNNDFCEPSNTIPFTFENNSTNTVFDSDLSKADKNKYVSIHISDKYIYWQKGI